MKAIGRYQEKEAYEQDSSGHSRRLSLPSAFVIRQEGVEVSQNTGSRVPAGHGKLQGMGSIVWGRDVAEVYDATYASMNEPSVVEQTVDLLVDLARGGRVLEFAAGTGRIALPLSARGLSVHGIELSPHMVEQMQKKPGAEAVPVVTGNMTIERLPGSFELVYVVANSIMNVTTQEEQVAVCENAAAHLSPGGHFVVELIVPQVRRVPPSEKAWVFRLDSDHVGIETFDDVVGQVAWSHHWIEVNGRLVRHSAPYRFIWPSELILMAKVAGFALADRWGDWDRSPFTSESAKQVAVFVKSQGSSDGPS